MAFSCKDDDMSKDGLMSIEAAPPPLKFKNKIVEKMFDSIFNFEISTNKYTFYSMPIK